MLLIYFKLNSAICMYLNKGLDAIYDQFHTFVLMSKQIDTASAILY